MDLLKKKNKENDQQSVKLARMGFKCQRGNICERNSTWVKIVERE